MPGLRQGSEDYMYVYDKFWAGEEGYDIDNYDGDAIWKDHTMPHFRDQYDAKQFKSSLWRMANRIRDQQREGAPRNAGNNNN